MRIAHLVPDETNATNLSVLIESISQSFSLKFQQLFSQQPTDHKNHSYELLPTMSSTLESGNELIPDKNTVNKMKNNNHVIDIEDDND